MAGFSMEYLLKRIRTHAVSHMMSIGTGDLQSPGSGESGVRCFLLCIYVANVKQQNDCGEGLPPRHRSNISPLM